MNADAIGLVQWVHARCVLPFRFARLIDAIDAAIPAGEQSLLDVGAGSGFIARKLQDRHPDWQVSGVDILVRPRTQIPVLPFDGAKLPFPDRAFDTLLLVDVLHHAPDPRGLLMECARVARERIVVKDHAQMGWGDRFLLKTMDWIGNASYGVPLEYRYLTEDQWTELYQGLPVEIVSRRCVEIYPFPLSKLMAPHLQIVYVLRPRPAQGKNS